MGRRNQKRGLEPPQTVEVRCRHVRILAIGLVNHQMSLFARFAQIIRDHFIAGGQSCPTVHKKQDNVCFFYRLH